MIVNKLIKPQTAAHTSEATTSMEALEQIDEIDVITADSSENKDLPSVFTLQAKSSQVKKSSKKPKPIADSYTKDQERAIREYLLEECRLIQARVMHQYGSEAGSNSSALKLAIKREITNYLLTVGNPIAINILDEYKARWNKNIYF